MTDERARVWKRLAAIDAAVERSLREGRAADRCSASVVREAIEGVELVRGARSLDEALDALSSWLSRWGLRTGHERFFGYPNASSLFVSVVGDALAARFDAQCALWDAAPAAVELERECLSAIAERAGWSMASSTFTTGASESITTALIAAGVRAEPRTVSDGVFAFGAQPRVYASREAHQSLVKSTRIAGWGARAVVEVESEAPSYAMSVEALSRAIERDRRAGARPIAVVATIGSTVTGAIDPIESIADLCEREGLSLLCDGAFGAAAALSDGARAWVRGIQRADAIVWDAHKFPGVSLGTGMLWLREAAWARAAFDVEATYVPTRREHPYATTMQWSRRATGLKVWLSLAVEGLDGWARRFESRAALGDRLRSAVIERGWTVRNRTPLPVVCMQQRDWDAGDRRYAKLARAVLHEHGAWVDVATTSDGATVLRAAIASERTNERAVDALAAALGSAWT
jgi:glutamate/tyrosine decarboxylase-like PLP-dependent enzyme